MTNITGKLDRPYSEQKISCDVCLKEIPPSEAKSSEGESYVLNFCGLDCYEEWRARQPEQKKDEGLQGP